jgi:hypothetical protein
MLSRPHKQQKAERQAEIDTETQSILILLYLFCFHHPIGAELKK